MTNAEKAIILKEKLNSVSYQQDKYKIQFEGTDIFISGVVTPKNKGNMLSKVSEYRTIYETICDLDWSIKFSLESALDGEYDVYTDDVCKSNLTVYKEKETLYYVENAIYREISLWDMLAQIYRVLYDVNIKPKDVKYSTFFDPKKEKSDAFKENATAIFNYIKEKKKINGEEINGVHKEVANLRNGMVHRISLGRTVMNNYEFNLRCPIYVQIQWIIEDYLKVSDFIKQALDKVDDTIKDYKEGWMEPYGKVNIK